MLSRKTFLATLMVGLIAVPAFAAAPKVGDAAPEIDVKEWLNAPTPPTLAGLKKNIVVVEFWATWCPPCVKSIPHLIEMHNKYKDKGVVILGLSEEDSAKVTPFAKKMKMSYPVGIGAKSEKTYGVRGIPTAFVIAPGGKIVWSGHPMNGLDQAVEKALADTPPQK